MHLVDGEHGHTHSHEGGSEHVHEHTHTHAHPHTHEDHDHVHTHETAHTDETAHTHEACGCDCGGNCCSSQPANEQEALLAYMVSHNQHHAVELAQMAAQLKLSGKEEAAAQIEKAVEDFEKGNMRLSVALSLVK